jgi:hypothetical protein
MQVDAYKEGQERKAQDSISLVKGGDGNRGKEGEQWKEETLVALGHWNRHSNTPPRRD